VIVAETGHLKDNINSRLFRGKHGIPSHFLCPFLWALITASKCKAVAVYLNHSRGAIFTFLPQRGDILHWWGWNFFPLLLLLKH